MSDVLKDSFELFDGTGVQVYGAAWKAQTFLTTSAYSISAVELNCWKYGSPGNITVSIRAVVSGKPSGPDLVSVTVPDTGISAFPSRAWYKFSFVTPYSLSDGTQYAIVWRAINGDSGNYFTVFGYDSAGYANGDYAYSANSGSSWSLLEPSNRDLMFRTYGLAGEPPGAPINPAPTDDEEDVDLYLSKLNWESGSEPEAPPETYDIWFGLIGDELVKIGTDIEETEFSVPGTLYALSNYRWRVDATNEFGTTTGDVWYFSTLVFAGYVRIGFSLAKDKAEGEGVDFHSDIIVDEFLYTSGMGHISETSTFDTIRKVNPGTGVIVWSALPLGSSQFPGKLCSKGDYLYVAGPTYPAKIDKSDGTIIKTYDNIFGGEGIAVDYDNQVFSCGQTQEGKNIWRSNDAGDSEISAAIGAGTLYDVQVIRIDGVDYIFVCGDYDAGQDCDVWKLDTDLTILSTYKSGGNSNRITKTETENFLLVLHTKADDGSGVQCHITALDFSLVVQDRILLDIDKQYEDFDRIQISTPQLYDSYVDNIDFQKFVRWIGTTNIWFAQTFTPNVGYDISSTILKLYRIDTPATGAVTISIRATDINGKPTGSDLCSGIIDGDTVTVNSEGEEIKVSYNFSHPLVPGTKYSIILQSPEIEHAYIGWKIDKADAAYSGGSTFVSYDGGSTWTADPIEGDGDFYFKTYGFL